MSQALEQFGKYILLERLAAGGMAEVYLSKSTGAVGVNKFVAIKRILPQYSDHQEFIDMFKEEAKIAVNLNHGNVVSIHDFGVEKGQFFLVMEYVEGRNLRQILNELKKTNTQFTIEQIIYIMKEVAAGLDHAHRCIDGTTGRPLNIVHRDMSPQNIMVSFDGEVKVIDFGIAKAENQMEATKAGTLKGKYGYMSPEQADGQNIDPRTDIFSMGIVLWELLANDRLFTSNSESAILRKIRDCQVPSIGKINPSIPPELERIVNKALAKDRSLRYQTAAAFHRDLNRFLNTQYPEFSAHDFSVFMKNAFSAAFLDQRRKLVEFSKIQAVKPDDQTVVTETDIRGSYGSSSENDYADVKLNLDVATDVRINLADLKAPAKSEANTTGRVPVGTGTFSQHNQNNSRIGIPAATSPGTVRPSTRPPSQARDTTEFAIRAILVVIVAVGAWWSYQNFIVKKAPAKVALSAGIPPESVSAAEPVPTATPASLEDNHQTELSTTAPEYTVQIRSNPDRARVVINGVDTGEYTPLRKTLKANVPAQIRLVKEGYSDFITTYTPTTDVGSVDGNLRRLVRVGILYIKIINGGANPELRISGVPVNIKDESEAYYIQAEVGVKIQAFNKLTGLSAEKTVTIHADQRDTVELYLK